MLQTSVLPQDHCNLLKVNVIIKVHLHSTTYAASTALCVTHRAGVQPRPQAKPAGQARGDGLWPTAVHRPTQSSVLIFSILMCVTLTCITIAACHSVSFQHCPLTDDTNRNQIFLFQRILLFSAFWCTL